MEFSRSPEHDRAWTQPLTVMLFNGGALILLGVLDVALTLAWLFYLLMVAMDSSDPESMAVVAIMLAGYRGIRTLGSFAMGVFTMLGARKLRDEGPHLLGYAGLVGVTVWPLAHLAMSFLSCNCMEMFIPLPFLVIGWVTTTLVMRELPQLSERAL